MLQSHCIVLSEQSCDLSMGQGERASVERPVAAGHLHNTVGFENEKWGKQQQTFHFVYFVHHLMKSDYEHMSVWVIVLVLREIRTQILSYTIC